jgi:hypothetical protein
LCITLVIIQFQSVNNFQHMPRNNLETRGPQLLRGGRRKYRIQHLIVHTSTMCAEKNRRHLLTNGTFFLHINFRYVSKRSPGSLRISKQLFVISGANRQLTRCDKSNPTEKYLAVTNKMYDAESRFLFIHGTLCWRRLRAAACHTGLFTTLPKICTQRLRRLVWIISALKNRMSSHKHLTTILKENQQMHQNEHFIVMSSQSSFTFASK